MNDDDLTSWWDDWKPVWPPKDPFEDNSVEGIEEFLHWPEWSWNPNWPPAPPPIVKEPSASDVLEEALVDTAFGWVFKSIGSATLVELGAAAGTGLLIGGAIGSAVPVFAGDDPNPSHHGVFGGGHWWYDELTGKGVGGLAKDLWYAVFGD